MRVAFTHCPVLTLGPGRRFGLWLQGCSRHCPGCISPEYQSPENPASRDITAAALAGKIIEICKNCDCTGITISGGEPFEQAEELYILCKSLREKGYKDILVYSGFEMKDLQENYPWVPEVFSCLVDGSFKIEMPTEACWKGSANQKAWLFNNSCHYHSWLDRKKKSLQLVRDEQHVHIIGIPRIEDVDILLRRG